MRAPFASALLRALALASLLAAPAGATTLHDQAPPAPESEGTLSELGHQEVADSFALAREARLEALRWWGNHVDDALPASESFRIRVHEDKEGLPGELLAGVEVAASATVTALREEGVPLRRYEASLAEPLRLPGEERLWLSILEDDPDTEPFRWVWANRGFGPDPIAARTLGTSGGEAWALQARTGRPGGPSGLEQAYALEGTVVPEPGTAGLLGAGILALGAARAGRAGGA